MSLIKNISDLRGDNADRVPLTFVRNRPREILFLTHVYGQGGGQNINIRNWAEGLAGRGYKVHVLYNTRDKKETEQFLYNGMLHLLPVQHIGTPASDLSPFAVFRMMCSASSLMSTNNIDVVSHHSPFRLPISLAAWLLKIRGVPLVITSHVARSWSFNPTNMAAMCVGLGNRLFASSMTSVGMLAGKPLGNNVTVIGNSVDRSLFDPESTSLHRSSVKFRQEQGLIGRTIIFCPARITPSKGQLDILKAAKHLKSLGYDFTYIFAGVEDKAYARKLREFAYKHFLAANVIMLGLKDYEEMPVLYEASDIIVLASHHAEGIPAAALEAFAMKRPFIGYDSGGTKEIVHSGFNGILVAENDIQRLASSIINVALNEPYRRSLVEGGLITVNHEKFTIKYVLDRLEEVLSSYFDRP